MKKNGFLNFLFSLIPGCGLMYLGYMKKGLQVMLTFAAATFIGIFFASYGVDLLAGFFFMLLPVVWFYQMFDSMHTIARMKNQGIDMPADDGFYLPDKAFEFSPAKNRKVAAAIACVLIFAGSISLVLGVLNNAWRYPWINQEIIMLVNDAIRNNLVPAVVSILLIIAGVKLLKGGKAKKEGEIYGKEADLA